MNKNFKGENGISIKILTEKLKKDFIRTTPNIVRKRKVKNSFEGGKLDTSDWKSIYIGLSLLRSITREGFSSLKKQLLIGKTDVIQEKKEVFVYKRVMEDFLSRLTMASRDEYELRKKIELLTDYSQISQAARDGILVKQEKQIEVIDGEEKEVIYDTSMTPREVISILKEYEEQAERLEFDKINNYLGLGLGLVGMLGTIIKNDQSQEKYIKSSIPFVTIGSTAIGGLKLLQGIMKNKDKEQLWRIRAEEYRITRDLLENEQISSKAEESAIGDIRDVVDKERAMTNKIENSKFFYNLILDLVSALLSGIYIQNKVQIRGNGKIDGKTLAEALISLQSTKGIASHFIESAQTMVEARKYEDELKEIYKQVQEIMKQMEEKVYPLEGARHSFDSISINNFTGKFYPKKDYETGEINYVTTIHIPEFSMKRGDVVLLSGKSGTGKSTFLRFLKRGDINNRHAIQLDNGEMVDNLGEEYLSFRPSIDLGNETNVLYQITGKKNVSELTNDEQKNLEKLLRELKFEAPNLLKQLSTKKFMEFSTGQQRRLALSKVFYRINDGTSVLIVDEPVGNVEDKLIREQLEMIKKYAQRKNIMLILTTHRLDLAEDLATKRYNINEKGILEQLPIIGKGQEERE